MKLIKFILLSFVLMLFSTLKVIATPLKILDSLGLNTSYSGTLAYSLRLLSSTYSGPLVRITISSSTYDVWPDATGKFSTSSIISAANPGTTPGIPNGNATLSTLITGSTSATVAIWYNQSGYPNNATAVSAPSIISAGVINTSNGLPAIHFSNNYLTVVSPVTLSNTNHTLISVTDATTGATSSLHYTGSVNANSALGAGYNSASSAWYGGSTLSTGYTIGNSSNSSIKILSKQYSSTNLNVNGYYNGIDTLVNKSLTCNLTGTDVMIGAVNTTTQKLSGNLSEVLIFIASLSNSDRQTIENNEMNYYFTSPNIRTQPSTAIQSSCVGSSVSPLYVSVFGTGTFTYQWYKNSTNSNTGGTLLTGDTSSSFTPDSSIASSYYYYAVITNSKGSTTSYPSGLITISNPPALSLTPGSTLATGTAITFTTNTTNGGNSPTYQWSVNGSAIANNRGSISFNGSNQYLTMSPGVTPGSGAYTLEGWFYLNNFLGVLLGTNGASNQMTVYIQDQVTIGVDDYNVSVKLFTIPPLSLYTWTHFAIVRDALGNETVFINGVRSSTGSISDTRNFSASSPRVGYGANVDTYFNGYISNLRMEVGSNIYDPTQSTITVPTTLLSAVTNTKLLLSASSSVNLLTDASGIQTITNNNAATWSSLNMFSVSSYTNSALIARDIVSCTVTANTGCYSTTATSNDTMQTLPTIGSLANITKYFGNPAFTLTNPTSNSNGTFSYSSSNTNVATISGNSVTIVGSGNTTITATQAANGYYAGGSKTALLTVIPCNATSSTTYSVICSPALPYTWNGLTFNTAGTQTAHLTNAGGCDSAATLVLTVKAPSSSTTNTSICPSALPYTWNGLTFNTAGTQTAHLTNAGGCDSAATLVLTAKALSSSTTNTSICPSALPYIWNGLTFNTAGTQTAHLTNVAGCDSAATLILTVKATSTSITNINICPSALPYIWNGLTLNAAGTQTVHLTNAAGCDSAATIVLTIKASSVSINTASICSGTSYTFNGTAYSTSGTYTFHTTNSVGCDSAATLILTIKANSTSTTNISICPGALPYIWNGLTFNAAGVKTAHITNAAGCDSAATINVTVAGYTWIGSVSSDWNNSNNWACGFAPSVAQDVTIQASLHDPVLTGDISVATLTINNLANLSLNGHTLTLSAITGTGKINGGSGSSLYINSLSANTLYFGSGATDSLMDNLTLIGSGSISLGSGLGITHLLSVQSGTLNTANHLTLKSTSIANTAELGIVGGNITGNVTVERYLPKGLWEYEDLSTGGVANAGSIFNNWQEKGTLGNYGIYITGGNASNSINSTNGFDTAYNKNASMWNFTRNNWYDIKNTRNTNLDAFKAYRTFIRGNRNYPLYVKPYPGATSASNMVSDATLRTTGTLVSDTVKFTTASTTSNAGTVTGEGLVTGINNWNLIANPYACPISWTSILGHNSGSNISTTFYYLTKSSGGFNTYETVNAGGIVSGKVSGSHPELLVIQQGQGFWIQNANSASPHLTIAESDKVVSGNHTSVFGNKKTNMVAVSLHSNEIVLDGTVAVFDNNYAYTIGEEDSRKLMNTAENIYIKESEMPLSIDGLPIPAIKDEIQLELTNLTANTKYELNVDLSSYSNSGLDVYIHDKETQTDIPATKVYSFIANSNKAINRFSLIFKPALVITVANQQAKVSLYPNPVRSKQLNLVISNLAAGTYRLIIINNDGQQVAAQQLQHDGGSVTTSLQLLANLTAGIYHVKLTGNNTNFTGTVIVK